MLSDDTIIKRKRMGFLGCAREHSSQLNNTNKTTINTTDKKRRGFGERSSPIRYLFHNSSYKDMDNCYKIYKGTYMDFYK